jgi:hypothetical protein
MQQNKGSWTTINVSRRKVLKKIAAGGSVAGLLALSGTWNRPVVNSIILPAHAQVTNGAAPVTTTTTATAEQDNAANGESYCTCFSISMPADPPGGYPVYVEE